MRATIANLVTTNPVPFAIAALVGPLCWVAKHLVAQWQRHPLNVLLPAMVVGWTVWEIIAGTWQLNLSDAPVYLVAGWFYARDARKQRDLEGWKRLNR